MNVQFRQVVTVPVLVAVLVGGCATQPVERIERHHDLRIDVSKVDFGARGTLHIIQRRAKVDWLGSPVVQKSLR